MHMNWKIVLCNPSHVLPRSNMDFWNGIRGILIENNSQSTRILASTHVLFVWTLNKYIDILKGTKLFSWTLKYEQILEYVKNEKVVGESLTLK